MWQGGWRFVILEAPSNPGCSVIHFPLWSSLSGRSGRGIPSHLREVPMGFGVSNSSSTMGAGFGDAPPEPHSQPRWVSKPRACCSTRQPSQMSLTSLQTTQGQGTIISFSLVHSHQSEECPVSAGQVEMGCSEKACERTPGQTHVAEME